MFNMTCAIYVNAKSYECYLTLSVGSDKVNPCGV